MTEFGDRLRAVAKLRGRTQWDLANALGVSQTTVSKWMRGEMTPFYDQLLPLARYLRVSIDYLAFDCEEVTEEALQLRRAIDELVRSLGLVEAYRRLSRPPRSAHEKSPRRSA